MNDLAIYGAGGFGREVAWLVAEINRRSKQWNLIGFFDDHVAAGDMVDAVPVLGGIDAVQQLQRYTALVIAVADCSAREAIAGRIQNDHVYYPGLIHPNALAGSETNFFGAGVIITAGCILTTGVVLGDFAIVNLSTTIGHDAKIGSFSTIMPGCNISGYVEVGNGSLIGTGVQVIQQVKIGARSIIGAGAVVTRDIPPASKAYGVPARVVG